MLIDVLALALGGFLLLVGISHFVVPGYYEQLVPPWLPGARVWVFVSGVAEILIGAGLLLGATRPLAAWAATGLMAVYVASHVDALVRARQGRDRWLDRPAGATARVVVNLAYFGWAAAVALRA
jgi:uncharacterized membrane protein